MKAILERVERNKAEIRAAEPPEKNYLRNLGEELDELRRCGAEWW